MLGVILLLAATGWRTLQKMMQPSQTRAAQLPGIAGGGDISVVCWVMAIGGQTLAVEVPQGRDFDRRIGTLHKVEPTGSDSIVMAGEGEVQIKAGALFDGVKTAPESIRVRRIMIVTGFVPGPPNPCYAPSRLIPSKAAVL
jgi:hypothetical protein